MPNETSPAQPKAKSQRALAALLATVLVALVVSVLVLPRPLLYDSDGYYHTAVAQQYAQGGVRSALGLRASELGESLGDKEFLFHVAMVPAVLAGIDSLTAGKLLLVTLLALDAFVVAWLVYPVIGRLAILLPLWLPFAATQAALRTVRLRPETLALALFLLALWALGRSRFRWLAVIAFVFTLTYTAFHALLGLCGLVFLQRGLVRGRWQPALVLYPSLGALLALVVHPQSPHHLVVWVRQTFDYFRMKSALDIGPEILPLTTDIVLRANIVLFLTLAVLWLARTQKPQDGGEEQAGARDIADAFGVGALVFGALFLLMARFSIYFVPVLVVWFLWMLESRGERLGRTLAIGRLELPLAAALVGVALLGVFDAHTQLRNYLRRTDAGPQQVVVQDHVDLSKALPEGAHVAANWMDTPVYLHWAAQGRYLNVLDPVFQAVPYPSIYRIQKDLFDGYLPDPVLATVRDLDSQFIAHSLGSNRASLVAQLEADPRVSVAHRQFHVLWRLEPQRNRDFILDWSIESSEAPSAPLAPGAVPAPTRLEIPAQERPWAAYVDLWQGREAPGCLVAEHRFDKPFKGSLSLAAWGPTRLSHNSRALLTVESSPGARIDQSLVVGVEIAVSDTIEVLTCAAQHRTSGAPGRGFYLRLLESS